MAMTLTSEVALIMLMSWLPVGGMMERMAWGRMMRRSARVRVMPKASLASTCPLSTDVTLAARGIAVLPGGKFSVRPTHNFRVTTGILANRYDFFADAIRLAAGWVGGGRGWGTCEIRGLDGGKILRSRRHQRRPLAAQDPSLALAADDLAVLGDDPSAQDRRHGPARDLEALPGRVVGAVVQDLLADRLLAVRVPQRRCRRRSRRRSSPFADRGRRSWRGWWRSARRSG